MRPTRALLFLYDKLTGRRILKEFREIDRRSRSSEQEIRSYVDQQLRLTIRYAVDNCPFYRDLARAGGWDVEGMPLSGLLGSLPVITKDVIRANFSNLVSDEFRGSKDLVHDRTGGSSGQPLEFAYDKSYKDFRWATIYHNLTFAGYRLGDPHGFIYGSNYDAEQQFSRRLRAQDFMMNAFRVNAFFLDLQGLSDFAAECVRRRPKFLIGYASALVEFAHFVKKRSIALTFDFVESTSESLSPDMRVELERTFGCEVFDRYGCREVGNTAHECRVHAGLHINWQSVVMEIVNRGKYPWLSPEYGDVLITSLRNRGMPLVRYAVEDIARIDETPCTCGHPGPRVHLAGTRTGDLLVSTSGALVSPPALTLICGKIPGIQQIQFVQNSPSRLVLNFIKSDKYSDDDVPRLLEMLRKVFGEDMEIEIRYVNTIEKEQSGKYRLTKRMFDLQE